MVSGYGWPVYPITALLFMQPAPLFRTVSPALPFQGKGLSSCLFSNVYFCLLAVVALTYSRALCSVPQISVSVLFILLLSHTIVIITFPKRVDQ